MTEHISPELLLRYVDGELSKKTKRKTEEHLRCCGACHAEIERLQEDIKTVFLAESHLPPPSLPPPPRPWPALQRLLSCSVESENRWPRLHIPRLTYSRFIGAVSAAAMASFVVAMVLVWVKPPEVSAKEVLRQMEKADKTRMTITSDRVVRQRLRLVRKERKTSRVGTVEVESWKSTKRTFLRASADESVVQDLGARYRSNGMAPDLTLSSPSYVAWSEIAGSEPVALVDGTDIRLNIAARAEVRARGFEGVEFRVRSGSWLVQSMTLDFTDCSFEMSELDFLVVEKSEVPLDVLAHLEPPATVPARPAVITKLNPSDSPRETALPEVAPVSGSSVDLAEIELKVIVILHQIGADLGEPIEVTRDSAQVMVDVSEVSPERKLQIDESLRGMPNVEIHTAPKLAGPAGAPATAPRILTGSGAVALPDERLTKWFRGSDMEEQFARSALKSSRPLLSRWFALKTLAERFSADREAELSETSRQELAGILREHAISIREIDSNLDVQFQVLCREFLHERVSQPEVPYGGDWRAASRLGLQKAKELDHLIRSLLTTTNDPSSVDEALPGIMERLGELRRVSAAVESPK